MVDGKQPAILGWLDDVAGQHRRQGKVTAQQVQVVAREQDHLSGPEDEGIFPLDAHVEIPLDDVVIEDQVGRRAKQRGAMLGRHPCRYAPRRAELGM